MKFTGILLTLGLSTSVLATPTVEARGASHVERDLPAISSVLSSISTKVEFLDSAIQGYHGGDTTKVQSASEDLVDVINSGTSSVKSTSELSDIDALGLQSPVSNLKDKISTVIEHLSGKKKDIVSAGKGGQTYNDLTQQQSAAKKLSDAIVSKVPKSLDDIATYLSSGISDAISDAISKGVADFKDVANDNGSSSSKGTDAPSPATTAAPVQTESSPDSSNKSAESSTSKAPLQPSSDSSDSESAPAPAPAAAVPSAARPLSLFSGCSSSAVHSESATPSSGTPLFTGAASVNRISLPAGAVAFAAWSRLSKRSLSI